MHIDISPASVANFDWFNQGVGTIIVTVKCDGTKSAMIPPTPDIDSDLRSALMKFVSDTQVSVGAQCQEQMYLVGFHLPSGSMSEVEISPPRR